MDAANLPNTSEGSAFGRMLNVMAAPGEVYSEIKERPVAHSNWLVPALVWLFIGLAGGFILFSQDWAVHEINKMNEKAIEGQIAAGKMPRQQGDQAMDFMRKYGTTIMKVATTVMTVLWAFGVPFFWGTIIWVIGTKIMKADFEYMKAVEAAGLAMLIYALAGVIALLLSFVLGRLASVSALFFLSEFDPNNKMHFLLGALNPFYLWFAGVMATSLSVLANVSWGKAAAWIFGAWVVTRLLFVFIKLGQFVM